MKKQIIIAGLLLVTAITFGQKKELKTAQKAINSGKFSEAISTLKGVEGLVSNADSSLKEQYYLLKGQAYQGGAGNDFDKMDIAASSFEKVISLNKNGKYSADAEAGLLLIRDALINSAILDQNAKENVVASKKLYRSYNITKKDTSLLFYAASNSINAQDYETAIKYYQELLDLGYTGIEEEYYATKKGTNQEDKFNSKSERDIVVKSKKYVLPKNKFSKSKRGGILRNMTLIYIALGKSEEASSLIKTARAENPDDLDLINAQANLYYETGDMVNYKKVTSELIEKDPDNPENFYNLGVVSKKIGNIEDAKKYYLKALELNPNYAEALINMADLVLSKDNAMIEEMNALGTSSADYDRYDQIQEERNNLYKEALPYLERASNIRDKDIDLIITLKNIYSQLGMDDKAKEMKARKDKLEG